MNKLFSLSILCFLSTFSISQTQWDYLGGLPVNMKSEVDACLLLDFEQNGSNEIKIVHGENAGCYFTSNTDIHIYAPTDDKGFWSDCNNSNLTGWTSDTAWIQKNGVRLSEGSHVLPFLYEDKYGFLVLKLTSGSDTLKVRGYMFLIDPNEFECYNLAQQLGLTEDNLISEEFEDYNLLGQKVDEYHSGLTIRLYQSGYTIKIYK